MHKRRIRSNIIILQPLKAGENTAPKAVSICFNLL